MVKLEGNEGVVPILLEQIPLISGPLDQVLNHHLIGVELHQLSLHHFDLDPRMRGEQVSQNGLKVTASSCLPQLGFLGIAEGGPTAVRRSNGGPQNVGGDLAEVVNMPDLPGAYHLGLLVLLKGAVDLIVVVNTRRED